MGCPRIVKGVHADTNLLDIECASTGIGRVCAIDTQIHIGPVEIPGNQVGRSENHIGNIKFDIVSPQRNRVGITGLCTRDNERGVQRRVVRGRTRSKREKPGTTIHHIEFDYRKERKRVARIPWVIRTCETGS